MNAKHVEDINEYVLNQIEGGAAVLACRKTALVKARRGVLGEVIRTDIDKTENTVKQDPKTGNPSWVITNPDGEEYIVEDSVFTNIYEAVESEEGHYRKKAIQLLIPCAETVEFVPSWGGTFTVEAGGYLTVNGYKDIAGIQSDAFNTTYEIISRNEADKDEALSILVNKPSYITWIGEYCGGPLPPNTKVIEIDSVHSFLGDDILAWLETSKSVSANEARHNPDFNPEKDIYYYIRSNHLSSKLIELQRDLKKSPR